MSHPSIELYYAEVCGLCHKAMDYFRSRELPFRAHEVFWDGENDQFEETPVREDMFRRCGGEVDFVPQIFVGDTRIPGWRALEPMIDSGEFDQLLTKTGILPANEGDPS